MDGSWTTVTHDLHHAVGIDPNTTDECWYKTTTVTKWVVITYDVGNTVVLHWDPDGDGAPPYVQVFDVAIARCTAEPDDGGFALETEVWDLVKAYRFQSPTPAFDPVAGIAGFDTYLVLDVPARAVRRMVSPTTGAPLDVEFRVAAVAVDWGDGGHDRYTTSLLDRLTPHPDGVAVHAYETRDRYAVTVAFDWSVRWRANGGPWIPLAGIADTAAVIDYPVGEIVVRRSS